MSKGIIVTKSYQFALKIVELYKFLNYEKKEYVMSRQILKSGTSIGANVEEAQAAISKRDFISKISIASKEARETHYWLRLLKDSNYLTLKNDLLLEECEELKRILISIVKTSQENLN
ncbi:MAG: four helix bundle protein [Flavobacteriaceae bacterium]|nr:four helix bundle protein [Flavobacteriaceae bacterium]